MFCMVIIVGCCCVSQATPFPTLDLITAQVLYLTFLSSQLTFLSSQLTFLSSKLTFLSSELTFLSSKLTFLSSKLRV